MKRKTHPLLPPRPRPRKFGTLARALVRAGRLGEAQTDALLLAAHEAGEPFVVALVDSQKMDAASVAAFISNHLGFPLIDPLALELSGLPLDAVPEEFLHSRLVLPLARRGERLVVAVADPTDVDFLDRLRERLGLHLELVVADLERLRGCLGAQAS